MSKLDDILNEASHMIAVGVHTDKWEKSDTKQQIKDLMLEIVKESDLLPVDEASVVEKVEAL